MGYKDKKYGITEIRTDGFDRLSISWDYWDNEDDLKQRKVTLLHIPDINDSDHNHITLDQQQAAILKDWLIDFFKEVDG